MDNWIEIHSDSPDTLPDFWVEVLLFLPYLEGEKGSILMGYRDFSYRRGMYWATDCGEFAASSVTHWMFLPDKPKKEVNTF